MFGPNLMIGAPDRVLDALITGGSWAAGYGASSMQDRRVTEVARSSSLLLTATKVTIDLGAAYTIRIAHASNHNAPQAGLWRIRAGTAAGLHDLYDSDWVDCHAITYSETGVEWLAPDWWGAGLDTGVYGCPYALTHILPADVVARYWSVEWDATASTEAYLQVGRLVLCPAFQPRRGAIYGADHGHIDGSTKTKLITGGFSAMEARAPRKTAFSLPIVGTGAEEYRLRDILRRQRTVRDVVYIPNPADPVRTQMTGFLGTLDELRGVRRMSRDANAIDLQMTESM